MKQLLEFHDGKEAIHLLRLKTGDLAITINGRDYYYPPNMPDAVRHILGRWSDKAVYAIANVINEAECVIPAQS